MRVLQLHNRYREEGGEDSVVRAEAELLSSAGHDVVTHQVHNPSGAMATGAALAMSPWNPLAAQQVQRLAERVRPDVAHVHNTWYALSPSVIAALSGASVPVVTTLHNYRLLCANAQLFRDGRPCEDCVGSHPWHGVRHRCYHGSALASTAAAATVSLNRRRGTWERNVAVFFATTQFAKERFVAGGLPEERIRVKAHPIADPGPRAAPPSASRTVVYAGRLFREKGPSVLVDAMATLQDGGLELLVIGDGPDRAALVRRAGSRIRFAGHLEPGQVRDELRRARALAFPSLCYETFGMSVVEAMAAGLPVLASDRGGTPEIVGDGTGRLVAPGNVPAWTAALEELADPRFVDEAGAAGRRRWQQRFSPPAIMPALEDAYRWAVEESERTSAWSEQ